MNIRIDHKIVGHRGYPARYPENSLAGLEAALTAGADAVEFDVQASADGVPLVLHDPDLARVAGVRRRVRDLALVDLAGVSVHEPKRLGEHYRPTPLPTLEQVVALLTNWPDRQAFVELKAEVFEHIDRAEFVRRVLPLLEPIADRCMVISFDLPVLRLVQAQVQMPVGWVLSTYNAKSRARVAEDPVDCLICDLRKLPAGTTGLWSGPWSWFIYDVVELGHLRLCLELGVRYIETWDCAKLLPMLHRLPKDNQR